MAASQMVEPKHSDALLELTTSFEGQDLVDRVSASRMQWYSLLG